MRIWREMALEMLDHPGGGLPVEVGERLSRIEDLIRKVKPQGNLESSQIVAVVVEQWQREQLHPGSFSGTSEIDGLSSES
jgi:hypothetical protein